MTSGHEEYWSLAQRNNVEAARNAGVHMAFFGEEVGMAKTRWENSIDGTNTTYRTLVCYKESFRGRIDPMDPPICTGAWRDMSYSPPDDGGRPEIALVGSQFAVDAGRNDTMYVDALAGRDRLWRNTSVAALGPGQSASYPQTLGTQWDESPDNGYLPPGLIQMSSSSYYVPDRLNGLAFWARSGYPPPYLLQAFQRRAGVLSWNGAVAMGLGHPPRRRHRLRRSSPTFSRPPSISSLTCRPNPPRCSRDYCAPPPRRTPRRPYLGCSPPQRPTRPAPWPPSAARPSTLAAEW